jgi:hypothetical protein
LLLERCNSALDKVHFGVRPRGAFPAPQDGLAPLEIEIRPASIANAAHNRLKVNAGLFPPLFRDSFVGRSEDTAMTRIAPTIVLLAIGLVHCTAAWGQYLPPEEFDRPFNGRVIIQEARDSDEVRKLCPKAAFMIRPLGCSFRIQGTYYCGIVKVPDEQIRDAGHDPAIFMRHEIGHCNGWGGDHKGAR